MKFKQNKEYDNDSVRRLTVEATNYVKINESSFLYEGDKTERF